MSSPIMTRYREFLQKASQHCTARQSPDQIQIQVGSATCENAAGARAVFDELEKHIESSDRQDILLRQVGCTGRCSCEPIVSIQFPDEPPVKYQKVDRELVHKIFTRHIMKRNPLNENLLQPPDEDVTTIPLKETQAFPFGQRFYEKYGDVAFFRRQTRIALRNSGIVNPECIFGYTCAGGYEALASILDKNNPRDVIDTIIASKLRGRGGGGYPTGLKWQNAAQVEAEQKYVICNADEGDPGAFMDRSMLEGDPFNIVEGMTIGAFAIGASQGYLYIRAEYPMAINRIQNAIDLARKHQLLGNNILGSDFSFDLEIRLGAGAFVCGEETALIHSIEGKRGQPRIRPPFPTQKGLWGCPTVINNVETWANIPVIGQYGPEWFAGIGTDNSGGTKVFALAGKINHTGLIEVPMGTTLREIVFDVGGGIPGGKKLKAIQTGGPAGGCIPAEFIDTKVDFDSLQAVGSIMGSGGMIVMDEEDCMVDIAKFFLQFTQSESCGKCTPCREGTTRMLEILERIASGNAKSDDIDTLERLARLVQKTSLCGLGRAAPNPVLSTIKYFRQEYEAHVHDKHCPACKCTALVRYQIDPETCVGCTLCARNCPVNCIAGRPKETHIIDQEKCIKCGRCHQVCRFHAVLKK